MKLTSLALASTLALSAAGAALAQPAGGAAPPPQAGAHHWGERGAPDPAQMAARRAERLRATLQLRPDQENALQAFVAAMRPSQQDIERRRAERAEAQKLTTPQRLDRMQAKMAERQAQFASRADAIKRFYAQLSPSQQRAFDALHEGRGMHGDMHWGHDGPGRPGMGRPGGMG